MTMPTAVGLSILLVYGAEIFPPKDGHPGVRVTVNERGACLLEAVGYPDAPSGNTAICRAAQSCIDAGLEVSFPSTGRSKLPARVVRRRS